MNPQEDICILRNRIIEDGLCFETVMAIQGMHSKKYAEKIIKLLDLYWIELENID